MATVLLRRILEQVRGLAGVHSASWSGDIPLSNRRLLLFVKDDRTAAENKCWIQVAADIVRPNYFETLGIPIERGRDFNDGDNESAMGAMIINESMARRFWPGENPVGKSMKVRGRARDTYRIVGVARNVRQRSLWEEQAPIVCLPLYQRFFPEMTLHVKTQGNPIGFLPAVMHEIRALDGELPVYDAGPLCRDKWKRRSRPSGRLRPC